MINLIPKPNYSKFEWKRLYSLHRQIQNPAWKGGPGDPFFDTFAGKTLLSDVDLIQQRIQSYKGKYGNSSRN